jgi:hypothetical protein
MMTVFFLAVLLPQARADSIRGEIFNLNNLYYIGNGVQFGINLEDHPGATLTAHNFIAQGGINRGEQVQAIQLDMIPDTVGSGHENDNCPVFNTCVPTVAWDLSFRGKTHEIQTFLAQVAPTFGVPDTFFNGLTPATLMVSVFDGSGKVLFDGTNARRGAEIATETYNF